ncbi:MAG: tight adherence protein [Actinomycetota bacterium]|nr:tight adherence protein [Actinomycetota bacterium]
MRILIIALLGSATAVWFARRARRYAVADRFRSGSGADRMGGAARATNAYRTRAERLVPSWLSIRVERALDAAALDVQTERALSTWIWSVTVAGVVGLGFGGPQIGFVLALVVAFGVPIIVLTMHERRTRQIAAAVPETLERVASELRSGGTVVTAIAAVATGEGPLASDMTRVDTRMRLGASLVQALGAWSTERVAAGVDASAGALAVCASVGGRSADALDGLATSLRDRLGIAAEARALSSQALMSGIVIAGAPVAYIAWSALVDPHAVQVLTGNTFGRACLALGLGLEGLGGWWMRSIIRSGSAP